MYESTTNLEFSAVKNFNPNRQKTGNLKSTMELGKATWQVLCEFAALGIKIP
jgi:hypothetical protein